MWQIVVVSVLTQHSRNIYFSPWTRSYFSIVSSRKREMNKSHSFYTYINLCWNVILLTGTDVIGKMFWWFCVCGGRSLLCVNLSLFSTQPHLINVISKATKPSVSVSFKKFAYLKWWNHRIMDLTSMTLLCTQYSLHLHRHSLKRKRSEYHSAQFSRYLSFCI